MNPSGPAPTPPPEEKLLRLIRATPSGPGAVASSAASAGPAAAPRAWPRAWAVPSAWMMGFNLVLGLVLVTEAGGWWWLISRGEPAGAPSVADIAREAVPTAPPVIEADEPLPSLASAASGALFGSEPATMSEAASSGTTSATAAPSEELKKFSGRLSLLGLIAGPPGEAIIEDAQNQKTYSVTVGQQVVDGIVLEEVRENRAVLSLNGEKIELSL